MTSGPLSLFIVYIDKVYIDYVRIRYVAVFLLRLIREQTRGP